MINNSEYTKAIAIDHSLKEEQENTQYDSLTQQYVYILVEKMPEYSGGEMNFLTDFTNKFQYVFSEHEIIQTTLQFQFVIDTEGHLTGARIYNKRTEEITDFEKAGLKTLYQLQNWQAGEHNNKFVNVLITKTIHLDFNN